MSTKQTPIEQAEAFLERRQDRPDHMAINVDDQWEFDDITYGTVRALVAQVRLDEQRIAELHHRLGEAAEIDVIQSERRLTRLLIENRGMIFPAVEEIQADIGAVIADNEALRRRVAQLTEIVQSAWNYIQPVILSAWQALKPLIDPDDQIMDRERLVHDDPALAEQIREGVAEAEVGLTADAGDFSQHLEDQEVRYSHGDVATCSVCFTPIEYVEETNTATEVLNSWWSHHTHPADKHEAVPLPPKSRCTADGCGRQIELRTEYTVLMADGSDGHGKRGGRRVLNWRHADSEFDHMHQARPEGPKWPTPELDKWV